MIFFFLSSLLFCKGKCLADVHTFSLVSGVRPSDDPDIDLNLNFDALSRDVYFATLNILITILVLVHMDWVNSICLIYTYTFFST